MTLLTIGQTVALDVGVPYPDAVAGVDTREMRELLSYINKAGQELARRGDWGSLTKSAPVTGTGTSTAKTVATDVQRLVDGVTVTNSSGDTVRPLTRAEWNMTPEEGTPRYFLLEGNEISFYPYMATADTCTVVYQSSEWCSAGTAMTGNSDTSLISEDALELASIVRWRRQKSMPYQDQEAEYEAVLAQTAEFDDRSRL